MLFVDWIFCFWKIRFFIVCYKSQYTQFSGGSRIIPKTAICVFVEFSWFSKINSCYVLFCLFWADVCLILLKITMCSLVGQFLVLKSAICVPLEGGNSPLPGPKPRSVNISQHFSLKLVGWHVDKAGWTPSWNESGFKYKMTFYLSLISISPRG